MNVSQFITPNTLPENNNAVNTKLYILDPLTVIIKLAILSNKPVGTKICIQNNVLYFQEPGPFQAVCRYFYKTNRTDIQYMYNPIQVACQHFLTKEYVQKTPRMKILFKCAQRGLEKLLETYKNCSIIRLCINYYYTLIANYVDDIYNDKIFHKDGMTSLYSQEIVAMLNSQWTREKITVILNLIEFLNGDTMAEDNVKSVENIVNNIDKSTQKILD
uniref:Uncharacterized protein n=1 Tax=viral metagenome TaxID=1070528 RepID=A0A6C0HHQ5_9ZZZZ